MAPESAIASLVLNEILMEWEVEDQQSLLVDEVVGLVETAVSLEGCRWQEEQLLVMTVVSSSSLGGQCILYEVGVGV